MLHIRRHFSNIIFITIIDCSQPLYFLDVNSSSSLADTTIRENREAVNSLLLLILILKPKSLHDFVLHTKCMHHRFQLQEFHCETVLMFVL